MDNDDILKMKNELDEVNCIRKNQERQIDELQKALLVREDQLKKREDQLKKAETFIREREDRIKFLEGQVDAYQYCLNCRR